MDEELVDLLCLSKMEGLGAKGIKHLISYCGSPSKVFHQNKSKLLKIPGVGEKLAQVLLSPHDPKEGKSDLVAIEKIGANMIPFYSPDFPSRLKLIPDGPAFLITKGHASLNAEKTVAIVGTRKATAYGKSVTERIVSDLVDLNVQIISGLAYGIDIHTHKSALKNNIPTLAVLAGGLDRIYPAQHKKYAEEMQQTGAILSESLPGTTPDTHLFPARNRIIAGMADAVIVIETAKKGGSLITAHLADSYDRPVFAVPGNIGNSYSEGTNSLIQSQKALIYTKVEDLIYHLNWDKREPRHLPLPELSEDEKLVYDSLQQVNGSIEIDLLAIRTQIPLNRLASDLLSLEFKNLVKSLPGKKYQTV